MAKKKYVARYNRYYQEYFKDFDTAKEAAQFLLDGEYNGDLSWNDITDPKGKVIADARTERTTYSDLRKLGAVV